MKASHLFQRNFLGSLPVVNIIHTVGRRKGLANFKSNNIVDTSQNYVTIMHPMLFNFVVEGYINESFCVPVKHSTTYI